MKGFLLCRAIAAGKAGQRAVPIGEAAAKILEPFQIERPIGKILIGHRGALTVDALDASTKRIRLRVAPDRSLGHVTLSFGKTWGGITSSTPGFCYKIGGQGFSPRRTTGPTPSGVGQQTLNSR